MGRTLPDVTPDMSDSPSANTWQPSWPLCLALLGVLCAVLLFFQLGSLGIWEPWEAQDILIAQEYLTRAPSSPDALKGHNWAVPTLDGKPVAASLLKVWLLAAFLPETAGAGVADVLGSFELRARLPFAVGLAAMVFASFLWVRRHWGNLAGLMTGVVLVCMPAVFVGAHSLNTPTLAMLTTSCAVFAIAQMVYGSRPWLWAGLLGVAMSLTALDARGFGLVLILVVAALWALSQLLYDGDLPDDIDHQRAPTKPWLVAAALMFALPLLRLAAAGISSEVAIKAPHVLQQLYILTPLCWALAALCVAGRTPVGRALWSLRGALAVGMTAAVLTPVLIAYADVNPTLLKFGAVTQKIPVLSFMLEQHLTSNSFVGDHVHFDLWIRQFGFIMFPWIALIPHGIAYLTRAQRDASEDPRPALTPQTDLRRLLMLWGVGGALMMAFGGGQGHHFFIAVVPIAAGVGLLLSDRGFWGQVRKQPLLLYAMGFLGVAIIMMLGKDIERYPNRLLEAYMLFEKDLQLPKDFSYSGLHKKIKYALALTLIVTCFGAVSWAILAMRNLTSLPKHLKAYLFEPEKEGTVSPMLARVQQREALGQEDSIWGKITRVVEGPLSAPMIIASVFALASVAIALIYVPNSAYHFSERHLFESYIQSAQQGAPLVRYKTPKTSASVYLQGLKSINSAEFMRKFEAPERFFAVVPRDQLAAVNASTRKRFGRDVAVLNSKSNRLVLLSNQLKDGEEDQNFIAQAMIKGDPFEQIEYKVLYKNKDGEMVHPTFDGKIQLLGYNLKPAPKDRVKGTPVYGLGTELEIEAVYKVLQSVPSAQQIFIHVDTRGNRIAGDHDPVNGEFPTNHWVKGDVIRDSETIDINTYTTQGRYSINVGFYSGSKRMKVQPRSAHGGDDRLKMGTFIVRP